MQQIPSLMSQQPVAPSYGAPPSSQAPGGYGQQQQQQPQPHQSHQGQGSYPPGPSGFNQPQQGGSWGPPTSGSGGQQPLLSQRKQPPLSLCTCAHLHIHTLFVDLAPGRSQSPPPPPWIQKQRAQSLEQQLKQTKLAEQSSLQQQGISNPLEMEFTDVVRPIMEACTKDAIAVRHSYLLYFYCDSLSLSLSLSFPPSPHSLSLSSFFSSLPPKAGKGWIFSQAVTVDECRQVARFIMRK